MASRRQSANTGQAVKVGKTRTGGYGSRVSGVAGRESSGSRTGMTDAAVKSGSQSYGRSSPTTGVGGYGGGTAAGGGVEEKTTGAGGVPLPVKPPPGITFDPVPSLPSSPTGPRNTGGGGGADAPPDISVSHTVRSVPKTGIAPPKPAAKPKAVTSPAARTGTKSVAGRPAPKNNTSKPTVYATKSTAGRPRQAPTSTKKPPVKTTSTVRKYASTSS